MTGLVIHPYALIAKLRQTDPTTTPEELNALLTIARTLPPGRTRADLEARVRRDIGCDAERAASLAATLRMHLRSRLPGRVSHSATYESRRTFRRRFAYRRGW